MRNSASILLTGIMPGILPKPVLTGRFQLLPVLGCLLAVNAFAQDQTQTIDVTGTWSGDLIWEVEGGEGGFLGGGLIFQMTQDGTAVIGTTADEFDEDTGTLEGAIEGNRLTLVWLIDDDSGDCEMFNVTMEFVITGDSMMMEDSSGRFCDSGDGPITVIGINAGDDTLTRTGTPDEGEGDSGDGEEEPGNTNSGIVPPVTAIGRLDGSAAMAAFNMGASADGGDSFSADYRTGDTITFIGEIVPDPADVGKDGELFLAIKTVDANRRVIFTYLNESGEFEPWDLTVAGLGPAQIHSPLMSSHRITLVRDDLVVGEHKIYMAYVADGGVLTYTGKALKVIISDAGLDP